MGVEQLIAFEAALAELSGLYVVAKEFRPLRERAEVELLPATAALGARLRRFVRRGTMDDASVDAAAREISALRATWRGLLADLHAGDLYQSCLSAYAAQEHPRLTELIPRLFAGCNVVPAPPALHYALSPSSGRRRPGGSPFLTPEACAARITQLRDDGIVPERGGAEWWDAELVPVIFASNSAAFDTPLALRIAAGDLTAPVFTTNDGESLRVYAPRLRARFAVVLQEDVDDEWWQAFSGSYRAWRDALADALRARAIAVSEMRNTA